MPTELLPYPLKVNWTGRLLIQVPIGAVTEGYKGETRVTCAGADILMKGAATKGLRWAALTGEADHRWQ